MKVFQLLPVLAVCNLSQPRLEHHLVTVITWKLRAHPRLWKIVGQFRLEDGEEHLPELAVDPAQGELRLLPPTKYLLKVFPLAPLLLVQKPLLEVTVIVEN